MMDNLAFEKGHKSSDEGPVSDKKVDFSVSAREEDDRNSVDLACDMSVSPRGRGGKPPWYTRHCSCCACCDRDLYQEPDRGSSRPYRCMYELLCPPYGCPGDALTFTLLAAFLYGSLWAIVGKDAMPGGSLFGLIFLAIFATMGGNAIAMIKPMPALLGMLLVGFALRNVPTINVAANIDDKWSSAIRTIALVVILIRAGLGLDWNKLRHMSGGALRLSFIPCLVETLTVAVFSKFLFTKFLIDFPWDWAFMLGFVHSAVSPAVVVPSMLELQRQGLGVDKGLPTLLIASGTLDDVIAISGFSLVLGITFSEVESGSKEANTAWDVLRAPVEVLAGIVYGILTGILCTYVPPQQHEHVHIYRFSLLLLCGLLAEFGASEVHIPGAGALAVIVMAFVAGQGWRVRGELHNSPVPKYFSHLWLMCEPLLFGLIGAAVDVKDLYGEIIGWGTLVLVVALMFRMVATFLAVLGIGLNRRECLYTTLAWLPKATVQAAIGSVALDTARMSKSGADDEKRGMIILALSVYVIIITAPIGAVLITVTAKHLLKQTLPVPKTGLPMPKVPKLTPTQSTEQLVEFEMVEGESYTHL